MHCKPIQLAMHFFNEKVVNLLLTKLILCILQKTGALWRCPMKLSQVILIKKLIQVIC